MTKGPAVVNKILVVGAGAIGCAAVTLTLGGSVASADDGLVGQTYKDAKATLSQQGFSPVVATTVGDRKDWDACIVTSATPAPGIDGFGNSGGKKMNVNLNCYSTYGTALWPGFSLQSPQGRKMHQADAAAKQQRDAQEAAAAQQAQDAELAATDAQQAGE
jgi:hypothetical protein